jgi:hypothetical protein
MCLYQSVQTVRHYLRSCSYLNYEKRKRYGQLTSAQKNARLNFALKHCSWTSEWKSVVFSDEKKFNLDGPDGLQYYWRDLRREPQIFSEGKSGQRSVMIWGAFGAYDKAPLAIIRGIINSKKYQEVLDDYDFNDLLPLTHQLRGNQVIFQQDNARPHVSTDTRAYLQGRNIQLLEDWPPRSPDLNPIENLWGILVRSVYANGRQFDSVTDLETQIYKSWAEITTDTLSTLVGSMTNRMAAVIRADGDQTDY